MTSLHTRFKRAVVCAATARCGGGRADDGVRQ